MPAAPGASRQQPGAADVGDQADAGLGHGEPRALGDDAVARVAGEADAAAHDDAVLDGDVGLGVAADQRIERVLVAPERARERRSLRAAVVEGAHVAAGAQRPVARAVEQRRARRPDRPARPAAPPRSGPPWRSVSALSACGRFMVMRPALPSRRIKTSSLADACMVVPLTFSRDLGISRPSRAAQSLLARRERRLDCSHDGLAEDLGLGDGRRRRRRRPARRARPARSASTGPAASRRRTSPSPSPSSR